MKASDAKPFVGKMVKYEKHGWGSIRYGIVVAVTGRNIIMDDDALWAPDIEKMELATQGGVTVDCNQPSPEQIN